MSNYKHLFRNRFAMVGVIVVTAIIGAAGMMIQMQRLASINAFRTATVNLGNGMSQQTAQSFASVDRVLREIATELTTATDTTPDSIAAGMRSRSTYDRLATRQPLLSAVDALLLVDVNGNVANATHAWAATEIDLSGRDFFTHFITGDDHAIFVGKPAIDHTSGKSTVFMARRINDSQGRFAGAVAGEISLTDLEAFYRLAMPARRSVYFVRRDGLILLRYPQRNDEIGKRIPDQSPWFASVAQGGGTYNAPGFFDQTRVIASVHPLRNLPFVVEASVTENDVLSEWYQQRLWVGFGGVSAVICALALLRLFAVQYSRLDASKLALSAKNTELDKTHRQLDITLANLNQGICFFDSDKNLVVFNRRFGEIYNLPEGALRPGMPLREIAELRIAAGTFATRTVDEYLAAVDEIIHKGGTDQATVELTNGRFVADHIEVLADRSYVVTHEDITARKETETRIAFLAHHDVLTGLANRVLFHDQIDQAVLQAKRGKGFALFCLDLDRFKAVNDTFGHPTGDSLLRAVAERLRDAVRDSDIIARLGGDEFAILLLGVSDPIETTVVARRIVESINEPFELSGHRVSVGTSIGIVMASSEDLNAGQLMKDADLALYRSKQEGRGTWRFFDPAMGAIATARRALEIDLKRALASGQFELHYQPVVGSRDRILTGFEALLRWRHPERGLVPPSDFIALAEEIGIIAEIGCWVLRQACAQAATWPDHLRVAVNLSTKQFRGPDLVNAVTDAIRTAGLAAARLELEITESVPLRQDQTTLATLHQLHALGTHITLDDFGTGYSSLSYLHGFPFDTIKIDRSFIANLEQRDDAVAIIRGIIDLAANLRMSVTAEGVETEAQFAFLAKAGCTEIQGYLISKPVPIPELAELIALLSGPKPLCQEAAARLHYTDHMA